MGIHIVGHEFYFADKGLAQSTPDNNIRAYVYTRMPTGPQPSAPAPTTPSTTSSSSVDANSEAHVLVSSRGCCARRSASLEVPIPPELFHCSADSSDYARALFVRVQVDAATSPCSAPEVELHADSPDSALLGGSTFLAVTATCTPSACQRGARRKLQLGNTHQGDLIEGTLIRQVGGSRQRTYRPRQDWLHAGPSTYLCGAAAVLCTLGAVFVYGRASAPRTRERGTNPAKQAVRNLPRAGLPVLPTTSRSRAPRNASDSCGSGLDDTLLRTTGEDAAWVMDSFAVRDRSDTASTTGLTHGSLAPFAFSPPTSRPGNMAGVPLPPKLNSAPQRRRAVSTHSGVSRNAPSSGGAGVPPLPPPARYSPLVLGSPTGSDRSQGSRRPPLAGFKSERLTSARVGGGGGMGGVECVARVARRSQPGVASDAALEDEVFAFATPANPPQYPQQPHHQQQGRGTEQGCVRRSSLSAFEPEQQCGRASPCRARRASYNSDSQQLGLATGGFLLAPAEPTPCMLQAAVGGQTQLRPRHASYCGNDSISSPAPYPSQRAQRSSFSGGSGPASVLPPPTPQPQLPPTAVKQGWRGQLPVSSRPQGLPRPTWRSESGQPLLGPAVTQHGDTTVADREGSFDTWNVR